MWLIQSDVLVFLSTTATVLIYMYDTFCGVLADAKLTEPGCDRVPRGTARGW